MIDEAFWIVSLDTFSKHYFSIKNHHIPSSFITPYANKLAGENAVINARASTCVGSIKGT